MCAAQSAGYRDGLSPGVDILRTRLHILKTVAQPVTVLQSRLLELYGAPSIYKGPDLLESTSVYELCSDSRGTQIALPPIQNSVRSGTAGMDGSLPSYLATVTLEDGQHRGSWKARFDNTHGVKP